MSDFLLYLKLGWAHIISTDALDHQLFVLALVAVYSLSDFRKILILITSFTLGHSLTLVLSVLDVFRISTVWVEFLVPLTIVITAVDNILLKNQPAWLMRCNYYLALIFGLVHGMGFANIARMSLASEQDILLPLLGFNIGLEIGQLLVVSVILVLFYLMVTVLKAPRRDWILCVSAASFALALQLAFQRLPF